MKKKFLSIILTLAMVVTMIPMFGVTASATENWNSGGDGSATNPYIISNYDQLNKFAEGVNSGTITTESKYFMLAKDFGKGSGEAEALTTPIGISDDKPFKGTFDGNGKTVKLNISDTQALYGMASMFIYLGTAGLIKNLSTSGTVAATCTGNDKWASAAASGICIKNEGRIVNCFSTVKATANHTSVQANVTNYNYVYASGIVTENYGTVENCYFAGELNGTATSEQCGKDVGSIVAYDEGECGKCYSLNSLITIGEDIYNGDELCLEQMTAAAGTYKEDENWESLEPMYRQIALVDALNAYARSNGLNSWEVITAGSAYPTFVDADTSWYNTRNNLFELHDVADIEGLAIIVNGGTCDFENKIVKLANDFACGTGEALTTPIGFFGKPFKGNFDGNGKEVKLNTIFNSENSNASDDVGLFGCVEGGSVKNVLTIGIVKGFNNVGGIVGYNDGGLVENCCAKVVISGIVGIGGIVGENKNGTVQNCSSSAEITGQDGDGGIGGIVGTNMFYSDENTLGCVKIINCHSMGKVSGWGYIGGIVGQNRGEDSGFGGDSIDGVIEIKGCSSNGMVIGGIRAGGIVGGNNSDEETIIEGCYATGDVSGNNEIGGIAGAVSGNIINCFVTGNVSANSGEGAYNVGGICGSGKATNCYMAGTVTATATGEGSSVFNIGGICGGGTATNCYMAGTVAAKAEGEDSSESFIGGVCGSGTATNCYYKASNSYKGICVGEEGTPTDAAGNTTPLYPSQMTAKSGETNYNWAAIKVGDEALGKVALVDALNKYAISAAGKEKGCKAWTQSVFVNKGYPAFGAEKKSGIMQLVIKGIAAITGLKLVKSVVLSPVLLKVLKWSTVLKIFK